MRIPTYARRAPKIGRASERMILDQPVRVHALMAPLVRGQMQESFFVILIDVRNRLIATVEVARGTLTSVEVHPREVFRPAVEHAAAGIILCHNHPSGDPTPSVDDVALTRRLCAAGALLGIPVVDHVVVTDRDNRSIAEILGTTFPGME